MKTTTSPARLKAFSLMEMVVVIAIAGILTLGIGVLLANSQSNWNRLVGRVYSDQVTDSFAIQNVFDRICRKSTLSKQVLGDDADSLELYYWDADSVSSVPENYAIIYQSDETVFVEYGKLQSGTWQKEDSEPTSTIMIARGVDTLKFTVTGTSVQMYLAYTDPDILPVICSSVHRNK